MKAARMNASVADEHSDKELKEFCQDIVLCLIVFGGMDEGAARSMLEESRICDPERHKTKAERDIFFHDVPYYYAMLLLHGQENPLWYNDPALWPPPPELSQPNWLENAGRHKAGSPTGDEDASGG